jgi:hypothetical protein
MPPYHCSLGLSQALAAFSLIYPGKSLQNFCKIHSEQPFELRSSIPIPPQGVTGCQTSVVRSRNPLSSSVISIYLRGHLCMYTRSTLPPEAACCLGSPRHLGPAQLNLYEPASIISMSDSSKMRDTTSKTRAVGRPKYWRLSRRQRQGQWTLSKKPVASPWRQSRSLEKASQIRGRLFWASSEERVGLRGRPTRRLTFDQCSQLERSQ